MTRWHGLGARASPSGNYTEIFLGGFDGAFVPGTVAGDGGLRVSPGANIFLGDADLNRSKQTHTIYRGEG
jgi:hypothetical protein